MRLRRGRHRWLRFWWKVSLRLEAEGSLSYFNFGKRLHFDAPVRVGYGKGTLDVAERVWFGWETAPRAGSGCILLEPRSPDSLISIGAGTAISNNVSIIAMGSIRIGQRCLIGEMVQIFDCDFHEIDPGQRKAGVGPIEAVSIGDNVWIGSRAIVLKGITIGDNSVIAAGSIVTRSIPSNSLAVGVPARVIRAL